MNRTRSPLRVSALPALQELAVAVEVEGSYLRGRLADQVAVADEDLVIPPAQGLGDAPIGPSDDGAARALLLWRQGLEAQDVADTGSDSVTDRERIARPRCMVSWPLSAPGGPPGAALEIGLMAGRWPGPAETVR